MKALIKKFAKEGIWMEDVPMPTIGADDVLVQIKKTAICGTDVHIYNWDDWSQKTIPVPMVVGHEFAGVIVELGSNVNGFKIGDRVSGEGHIVCGHCRNCRGGSQHLCPNTIGIGVNCQGCFAEYLSIPARNVYKLPEKVTDDLGAILDPMGNATHTALSWDLLGEDVLITGAGPIGIMAARIAKFAGARNVVITDINPYRLELARRLGVTRAVDSSKENLKDVMHDLAMSEGFDVGLEMSGNGRAFGDLLKAMKNGGKVSLLGIMPDGAGINWSDVIFKGLMLKGIYGREMFETWYKMGAMIEAGLDMNPIITHRFKIDEFQKGFDAMRSGQSGKVILDWE